MTELPDLIVGVDFGMTCSGVAYANPKKGQTVRTIQRWPDRGQANENKVPSVLCYPRDHPAKPIGWGFASENRLEQTNQDVVFVDWFKTQLDERVLKSAQAKDPENSPQSIDEVERWYVDYMRLLYQHIQSKLSGEIMQPTKWETATVEFLFSVPTTWAPHPTVERFRSIVSKAGFGTLPNHSISVGLTEAEAAAVSTSVEAPGLFQEKDVLLVCDIGGGTTDITILRVLNVASGALTLKQIDVVIGRTIGAVLIDSGFEDLCLERLQSANEVSPLGIDVDHAAWLMSRSREFQSNKCDLGSPDEVPIFSVPIFGLNYNFYNETAGITGGCMRFTSLDLKNLFDVQIRRLFEFIDKQIASFGSKFSTEMLAHIVLSGGLGNNVYIQQQLNARYAFGASTFSCAKDVKVSVATDPQLAVCKGIVADRLRKSNKGQAILGWRCCRASYGTICKVLYDKTNPRHNGRKAVLDPLTNKHYVMEAVAWFIKKGQPVSVDTLLCQKFTRNLRLGDPDRTFPTSVVTCNLDKDLLPLQLGEGANYSLCQLVFLDLQGDANLVLGAELLCQVKSDLSSIDESRFKLKNRHWWNFGERYRRCSYTIKVIVGAADINFELYFEDEKLSKDNPISVEWSDTTESTAVELEDAELGTSAVSRSRRILTKSIASSSTAMFSNTSLARSTVAGMSNISLNFSSK